MNNGRYLIWVGFFAISACAGPPMPAPQPPPPAASVDALAGHLMLGLQESTGGAFTLSPQGEQLSVLYDDAILRWLPAELPAKGAASKKREGGFTIASRHAPLRGTMFLRGFSMGPTKAMPRLILSVGGTAIDLSSQIVPGNFTVCTAIALPSQQERLGWTLSLDYGGGQQADLHLDSIDIAVARASSAGSGSDPCVGPATQRR